MVYAARVSELAGVAKVVLVDDHRRELEAAGLPTKVKGLSWKQVRERMTLDKKYAKGLRFVLLTEPGKPVVKPVSDDVLEAAFREVVR
jgi:3-dehydroquinate synthetase